MSLVSFRLVAISSALIISTGDAHAGSLNDLARPNSADQLHGGLEVRGSAPVVWEQPSVFVSPQKLTAKREAIVQKICRKYNHCAAGKSEYGERHLIRLDIFLHQLIMEKLRKYDPEISSFRLPLEGFPETKSIQADIFRLTPLSKKKIANQSPRIPRPEPIIDPSFVLGICAKYKHCSDKTADELHCYQLESLLLRLKTEKELLVQTPTIKRDIRLLDSDLLKLKGFGYARPSGDINEPFVAPSPFQ